MPADRPTIGFSDLAAARGIFGLVGHIPVKADEMTWLAARSYEDVNDIFQRLLHLGDKIVALELCARVPADLAGNENLPALRSDAVRVASWLHPVFRLHDIKQAFT